MDTDPESVVRAWDDKLNAHDVEGVVALFTDDAVVRIEPPPPPPTPGTFTGKEPIRQWAEGLVQGFHGEPTNFRRDGDRVMWDWTISADIYSQLGVEQATGTGELVMQGDKAKSFTATNSQETLAQIQAAAASGGASG